MSDERRPHTCQGGAPATPALSLPLFPPSCPPADTEGRNANYADLVNSYYNLATDFYEWGWGQSFHLANKLAGESFGASIARHEYYLTARLGVKPGDKVGLNPNPQPYPNPTLTLSLIHI